MHAMFPSLRTGKYVKHAKESVVSHLMPHLIRIQRVLIDISSLHKRNGKKRICQLKCNEKRMLVKTAMKYNDSNPYFTRIFLPSIISFSLFDILFSCFLVLSLTICRFHRDCELFKKSLAICKSSDGRKKEGVIRFLLSP